MNSNYFLAPQAQIDLAKIAPSYRKPGLEKSCAGNPTDTKLGAASTPPDSLSESGAV